MPNFSFNDGTSVVTATGPRFAPNFPVLTGDILTDTLNALLATRLAVLLAGPRVSYVQHGHAVHWTEYQEYLDRAVLSIRKEIAQANPFEEIGLCY